MDKPLILIVDDAPTNIHALTQALGTDYRIKAATRGQCALDLARRPDERPDLILLDILMPDLNGYEVCRSLKFDPLTIGIPIVFITSLDEEDYEARGLDIGAIDYITKPFSPAVVRARVRNHLAIKRDTDRLEALAAIDSLTGLANRRRFDETLAAEWNRCQRSGQPLSVVFADIDHFKVYNDHFGHGGGDACLTLVARALAGAAGRAGDTVFRYGGEEFVAVLPATHDIGAGEVASNFRAAVAALDLPQAPRAEHPRITVSVGYASVVPKREHSPTALIELADRALYHAKREGRDCVRQGRWSQNGRDRIGIPSGGTMSGFPAE